MPFHFSCQHKHRTGSGHQPVDVALMLLVVDGDIQAASLVARTAQYTMGHETPPPLLFPLFLVRSALSLILSIYYIDYGVYQTHFHLHKPRTSARRVCFCLVFCMYSALALALACELRNATASPHVLYLTRRPVVCIAIIMAMASGH